MSCWVVTDLFCPFWSNQFTHLFPSSVQAGATGTNTLLIYCPVQCSALIYDDLSMEHELIVILACNPICTSDILPFPSKTGQTFGSFVHRWTWDVIWTLNSGSARPNSWSPLSICVIWISIMMCTVQQISITPFRSISQVNLIINRRWTRSETYPCLPSPLIPMANMSEALPNLAPTLGAVVIGIIIAVFLCGILTLQTWIYFRTFLNDSKILKGVVRFLSAILLRRPLMP